MATERFGFGFGNEDGGRSIRRRGNTPHPDTSGAAELKDRIDGILAENEVANYEDSRDYGPPEDVDYYQDPTRPAIPEALESGDPEIASRGGFDPEAPLGRPIDPEEY